MQDVDMFVYPKFAHQLKPLFLKVFFFSISNQIMDAPSIEVKVMYVS